MPANVLQYTVLGFIEQSAQPHNYILNLSLATAQILWLFIAHFIAIRTKRCIFNGQTIHVAKLNYNQYYQSFIFPKSKGLIAFPRFTSR